MDTTEKMVYGNSSEQFLDWYGLTDLTVTPKGVVVLIHGGFWREEHTLQQMHPLAKYLQHAGWLVANIEYRRSGCGGDWPAMLEDVKAAFVRIQKHVADEDVTGPIVGIGHSVGGQLALLTAEHQDFVIALAPVTDVARTGDEQLGEQAVQDFFGELAESVNFQASPIHNLPMNTKVLLIHGRQDQRVPLVHSEDFVQRLESKGGDIESWTIDGLDHFYIISPECVIWPEVVKKLNTFS